MNKDSTRQRPWQVSNGAGGDHACSAQDEGEWGERLRISAELQDAMRKFRRVIRSGCWTVNKCGPSMYRTCEAFRQGVSCFDLPSTACCDVNRKRCISCPTFIQIVELPKQRQAVTIYTDSLRVEGFLHCPVGMRVIDALNVEDREFIAITDARVESLSSDTTEPFEAPFLALSRSQIITLAPQHAEDVETEAAPPARPPLPDLADPDAED
jgi:hypothetical protein